MNEIEINNFTALQSSWLSPVLMQQIYNIDLANDGILKGGFLSWSRRLHRKREVYFPDKIHRHAFEIYLQFSKQVPYKWGAARLGMSEHSLRETIEVMSERGILISNNMDFSGQVIGEDLVREFYKYFEGFQQQSFGSHSSFCKKLHETIQKELDVEIEPLFCVTSQIIDVDEPDYSHSIDKITQEPIGLRYTVWLELDKSRPISLEPDACSLKLFVEKEELLTSFLFPGQSHHIHSHVIKLKEIVGSVKGE